MSKVFICASCQYRAFIGLTGQQKSRLFHTGWSYLDANSPSPNLTELLPAATKESQIRRTNSSSSHFSAKFTPNDRSEEHLQRLFQSNAAWTRTKQHATRPQSDELVFNREPPASDDRKENQDPLKDDLETRPWRTRKKSFHPSNSSSYQSKIHAATENRDLQKVEDLWTSFISEGGWLNVSWDRTSTASLNCSNSQAPFQFENFRAFLLAFLALNDFEKFNSVCRTLLESDLHLPLFLWEVIFRGFALSRDWRGQEKAWQVMIEQGSTPDNRIIKYRLKTLVQNRQWRLAVDALTPFVVSKSGLEQDNHSGSKKSVISRSPVLPIDLVNIVLKELLYLDFLDDAHGVLVWAEGAGVSPNTATMNLFVAEAVRSHNFEQAYQWLGIMQGMDLAPDAATFSVILNGLFRQGPLSASKASPEAQRKGVDAVLREMEQAGMKLDRVSYSILVGSLLRESSDIEAARAVLHHMQEQKVQPSLELCATLANYYFQQSPPDTSALDELWNGMRFRHQQPDRLFNDRMMEGYSGIGEVGRMMVFFRDSQQRGFLPSWPCLLSVLESLLSTKEYDLLDQLVADARKFRGVFRDDNLRNVRRRREFYARINELEATGERRDVSYGPHVD